MFTSENVLCAELINENSIKVTHKEGDDVLITTIQKNPRKESYKSLIDSGWTLKKIKERTKELQKIEDPNVRRIEVIAGGYSWALDQLEDKQAQFDTLKDQINVLVTEVESLNNDIRNLEKDRLHAAQEVKTMWGQHKEAWTNQNKAVLELVSIYDEHEKAVSELRKIYDEQDKVSDSYEKNLLNYKNDVQQMKVKFQQNYDKYQELYGLNVTDFLFETADIDKEMLFKVKLECLSREELKKKDKSFKSKVRKAKTMHELIKLVVNELEK